MSNTSKVTVVALPELRPRERRRMGMLWEGLKNMEAQVTDREALSVLQRKKGEKLPSADFADCKKKSINLSRSFPLKYITCSKRHRSFIHCPNMYLKTIKREESVKLKVLRVEGIFILKFHRC